MRSKLLYTLLFFALVLIGAGVLLAALSYVERDRILQDVGLAAIRFFGVAIAIFVGVGLIHKEVDRRTVYTILSKPLSRGEFLLGKYVGLVRHALAAGRDHGRSPSPRSRWLRGRAARRGARGGLRAARGRARGGRRDRDALLRRSRRRCSRRSSRGGVWIVGQPDAQPARSRRRLRSVGSVRQATELLYRVLPDLASFNLSIEAAHGLPVAAVRRVAAARSTGRPTRAIVLLARRRHLRAPRLQS